MKKNSAISLISLMALALFLGACSKQAKETPKTSFITAPDGRQIPASTSASGTATDGGLEEVSDPNTLSSKSTTIIAPADEVAAAGEGDVRGTGFAAHEGLQTLYFDFDKYSLSQAEQAKAAKNADQIKAKADEDSLVEGHCDQRGTIEYNIALGQKRAREVRDYYIMLGAKGEKISTISYGKEKPVCADANEACWSKNRRAETKTRLVQK